MENLVSNKEHPMYSEALKSIGENFSVEPEQAMIIFDALSKEQQELILYYKEQLAYANSTVAAAVSAAEEFKKKLNFGPSLSAGFTAYDRLRWQYLDANSIPKSVHDIPFPRYFNPEVALKEIEQIGYKFGNTILTQMHYLTTNQQEGASTMYTVLCGDEFVVDKEKMKKHFEYLEFVRHIDMETVRQQPVTVAMKVVNEFVKTYRD